MRAHYFNVIASPFKSALAISPTGAVVTLATVIDMPSLTSLNVLLVEEQLRPEHFYREQHGAVFAAMKELFETDRKIDHLTVGETLMLEIRPDALVSVRCGDVILTEGRMGRVGDRVAVRVGKPLRKPRTTLAMFEGADLTTKRREAT